MTTISPIHVRYRTSEEAAYVKAKAAKADISVNSFIRAATLDHIYVPPYGTEFVAELRMVKRQLTGIGINLNQLMHRVNAGSSHTDPVLDYIDTVRTPVLDAVGIIRQALSRNTTGPLP